MSIKQPGIGLAALLSALFLWGALAPTSQSAMPGPSGEVARPPIVEVANISLKISDLAKSKEFYSDKLGYEVAFTTPGPDGATTSYFKVDEHQYIELTPNLHGEEDRLIHIGLETPDVKALRSYLADHGVSVPPSVGKLPDGTLGFEVKDPDGHQIQFVQYVKGSDEAKNSGKFLSARRISHHILHAGIVVQNQAAADAFYQNTLGLHTYWNVWAVGGCCINLRLPNGSDWLEYMMHPGPQPLTKLGGPHHICLGVDSVADAYKEAAQWGFEPAKRITRPRIGRNGPWQFNLYDPDGTRVEMMDFKNSQAPSPPYLP